MKIAASEVRTFLTGVNKLHSGVYRETLQQSQRKERLGKAAVLRHVVHHLQCFYLVKEAQKVELTLCKDSTKHTGAWRCNPTNC